jgi:hypothetical protein
MSDDTSSISTENEQMTSTGGTRVSRVAEPRSSTNTEDQPTQEQLRTSGDTPPARVQRDEIPSGNGEKQSAISASQLAANHENVEEATGRGTVDRETRSSQNALRHGPYPAQRGPYSRSLFEYMTELGEDEFVASIEDGLQTSFPPMDEARDMLLHERALLRHRRIDFHARLQLELKKAADGEIDGD